MLIWMVPDTIQNLILMHKLSWIHGIFTQMCINEMAMKIKWPSPWMWHCSM